jgi:Flp pilus assembly protein TadD
VTATPSDGGSGAKPSTPSGAASSALPPPKPTTISLATTSDDKADPELAEGDKAFEKNDLTTAAKRYDAARIVAPSLAAPIVGLARVRIAKTGLALDFAGGKGNAELVAAIKELRRAVQMEPAFGPGQVELGRALLMAGDAPGAIEPLRKGAAALPHEAEAHSALGVAYLASGGHGEEAVQELTRAAELDSGSAPRHGNLGTVLFMRGKVKEAIKEYELQVRLVDGDARAHSDLGTALLADNQIPRALVELERAVALDPRRATFRSNLGYAFQIVGKLPEAIAHYRAALKLDDKLGSAWINLATALAKDPKTRKEARAALERAKGIDPTDPRVKANLEELDALEKSSPAAP